MAVDSIFNLAEFKHLRRPWDARQKELSRRRSYYDGTVYKRHMKGLDWLAPRLYKGIKPLYLPLSRAVDIDAGIIPSGWSFAEDDPDAWSDARDIVFNWSKWRTKGVLLVHYGAQYGVVGLRVADLRDDGIVVIKPQDPLNFILSNASDYTDEIDLALYIEEKYDDDGESFEYAEAITPESVRIFRNGVLHDLPDREAEYKNELGFVPFVEVRHIETGEDYGEATYQKAIPLLNEVNELASYLADIIKRHAEPQWAVIGSEPVDLTKSGDNVWFLPQGADVKPVVAGIDIGGVLEFVREIRDQVHGALPELSFDELRKKDQIATATLELQLLELVVKIHRARPNYDDGLAAALRMAGQAAKTMNLADVAVLDADDLALDQARNVLPVDESTELGLKMQRLQLEAAELSIEQSRAMTVQEGAPVEPTN